MSSRLNVLRANGKSFVRPSTTHASSSITDNTCAGQRKQHRRLLRILPIILIHEFLSVRGRLRESVRRPFISRADNFSQSSPRFPAKSCVGVGTRPPPL